MVVDIISKGAELGRLVAVRLRNHSSTTMNVAEDDKKIECVAV